MKPGETGSLFGEAPASRPAHAQPRPDSPLAERIRPRTLDEILGQDEVIGPGQPLRRAIEQDQLRSLSSGVRPAPARRRSRS